MGRKAEPVRVITSADLIDNGGQYKLISKYAIKVSGDDNATELIGGAPIVVYPVPASDIGDYNLIQGEPIYVAEAPVSRGRESSRWAYPVYHVGPGIWPSPAGSAPSAPSSLTVTENGADTIDLAWTDNSSDETGFEIERRTLPGGSFALIHTTTAGVVVYADSGLSAGGYEYRVRAVNSFGNSAYSNTDSGFLGAYNGIPNLVHVYEPARRTLTSYTGSLVRIRRSSDNVEQDFGYVANGDLDTAAIATFIGGGSGFVVTVYDQVGSNNPTQATAGNQPAYVASGQNGKPVMRFNGTSHWLRSAFSAALSQPFSVYAAAKSDVTGDGLGHYVIDGDDSINRMSLFKPPLSAFWALYAGAQLNGSGENTNWNLWSALFNNLSGGFWINSANVNAGSTGAQNPDGVIIGARNSELQWWDGDIASVVIADPSHSTAEREAMQDAINDYWAVY